MSFDQVSLRFGKNLGFFINCELFSSGHFFLKQYLAMSVTYIPTICTYFSKNYFLGTPVLLIPKNNDVPLGMIFSCFMVCIMIGSSIFSWFLNNGWKPGDTLKNSAVVFAMSTAVCTYTANPKANIAMRNVTFGAFLVLETAIGLYFPSVGVLRSQVKYKMKALEI